MSVSLPKELWDCCTGTEGQTGLQDLTRISALGSWEGEGAGSCRGQADAMRLAVGMTGHSARHTSQQNEAGGQNLASASRSPNGFGKFLPS